MADKHGADFQVTDRDETHRATRWVATCKCKNAFVGSTYESVEDQWREHVWQQTGEAPEAWGADKSNRWQVPA